MTSLEGNNYFSFFFPFLSRFWQKKRSSVKWCLGFSGRQGDDWISRQRERISQSSVFCRENREKWQRKTFFFCFEQKPFLFLFFNEPHTLPYNIYMCCTSFSFSLSLLQEKWHLMVVSTQEIILLILFYTRCDLANAPSEGVILLGTSTREVLIYLRSLHWEPTLWP